MSSTGGLLKNNDTAFNQNFKKIYLENHKIWHATIELTYRCNFKCKHCYCHNENKQELTLTEIEYIAKKLKELGVITLTLTGGEALLRKDIFEIINCFKKYGFIITLFSNAYLIDENIANKLKILGVNCVEISIYGANNETYNKVTGVSDGYDKLLKAYDCLKNNNISIVNKSVSLSLNIKDARDMINIGLKNGSLKVKFDPIIFPKTNHDKSTQNFRCDDVDVYQMYRYTLEKDDVVITERSANTRVCSVGGSIVINPYGEVYPCTAFSLSMGNIRNRDLIDIWNNSEELKMLQTLSLKDYPNCIKCEYYDFCNVCPALFYMENKSVFLQSKECCRLAQLKKSAFVDKFDVSINGANI